MSELKRRLYFRSLVRLKYVRRTLRDAREGKKVDRSSCSVHSARRLNCYMTHSRNKQMATQLFDKLPKNS